MATVKGRRGSRAWVWFWVALGALYFLLPLYGTLDFSLRLRRDVLSLDAYANVLGDAQFRNSFLYSTGLAVATILASMVLLVPTAYWVHLRLPRWRPVLEFVTLLPFVVPPIVLVFGLIRLYSRPPLLLVTSPVLLVAGYVVLSFPYMYRAIDTGLRAMDVRSLTEAAQSLGARPPAILWRVILPNLRVSLISGAFLTFATVIGEFTMAALLNWPAFGPYLALIGGNRAYEPAALAILSFGLTWATLGLIGRIGRGAPGQTPPAGGH